MKKIGLGQLASGAVGLKSPWELNVEQIKRGEGHRQKESEARLWFYPITPSVTVREDVAAIGDCGLDPGALPLPTAPGMTWDLADFEGPSQIRVGIGQRRDPRIRSGTGSGGLRLGGQDCQCGVLPPLWGGIGPLQRLEDRGQGRPARGVRPGEAQGDAAGDPGGFRPRGWCRSASRTRGGSPALLFRGDDVTWVVMAVQ